MADSTAAYPSVGVWEQLHCFFFAWVSRCRFGSSLASAWRGRLKARARLLPQTHFPWQRRNSGVAPTRQRKRSRI